MLPTLFDYVLRWAAVFSNEYRMDCCLSEPLGMPLRSPKDLGYSVDNSVAAESIQLQPSPTGFNKFCPSA